MAELTYENALARLLSHEGGYTNHPSDPGGPTNFGITIYDYRKYVKSGATAADIKAMQLEEAKRIYRAKYWDSQRCSDLEPGVDYAIFDYGVNSGIGRSGRVLRRILGVADNTSEITQLVVSAANEMKAASLAGKICDERLKFLQSLKTWPVFGKGWSRRVAEVKDYSLRIANDLPMGWSPPIIPAAGRGIDPDKFAKVRALQQHLADSGFDLGTIDGDLGPKTIKAFQRSIGLIPDGVVGKLTQPMLTTALNSVSPKQEAFT